MKKALSLMITVVMLLSLASCGNSDTTSNIVIYEEETIYDDSSYVESADEDNSVTGDIVSSDDKVQSDVSSEQSKDQTSSDDSSSTVNTQENIYRLNDTATLQNIKLNGRCDATDKGINLNMSASAIEFNTDSTSILLEVNASSGVYYTIMVDGQVTQQHQPIESFGAGYVVVARGLKGDSHNVKFIRDSEARGGLEFTVVNIQLDEGATLLAKDADKNVIEFLGDSLTSGYGNLITGAANASDLKNQSATKAYPYLLANKLDMDYRIVSMSGIALGLREGYPTFPEFYSLESYHIDKEKKYASSNPADVDVVVVNLGTNDASDGLYNEKDPQSVENYGKRYADLITNIGYSKDVKVVFVSGVCWCHTQTAAYNAAKTELKSRGYNNTYSIDIRTLQSGGGGHPSAEEHVEVADTLYKFFKDNKIA